jgi:conjugal transfer pilus assembly protein TrbC
MKKPFTKIVAAIAAAFHLCSAFAGEATLNTAETAKQLQAAKSTQVLVQIPNSEALAAETNRQVGLANEAIRKAAEQASLAAPSIPRLVAVPTNAKAVDPAEIAKRYKDFTKPALPELYVLVSFSMPDSSLDRLADLSSRAGVTLVLLGLHKDSLKQTLERVSSLTKKYADLKVTIDPTLFRKYGVEVVPTFVLVKPAVDQNACTKACAPQDQYASLSGDVTLDYALEYMASKANPDIASQAKTYLEKLRRVQ